MRRARENKEPMTRAEVRAMAAEQEVWVAATGAADRVAGVRSTPPPLPVVE